MPAPVEAPAVDAKSFGDREAEIVSVRVLDAQGKEATTFVPGDRIAVVFGGRTTKSFRGFPEGRYIQLHEADVDLLRREIARLEPSRVYFPMGIGGHVDHQLARQAGLARFGGWVSREGQ